MAATGEPLNDPVIEPGLTLAGLLDADVSGRDFPRGKPDPAIFLAAADELGTEAGASFVVEDSPAGVQAAKAGTMHAIGVARLGDNDVLRQAGADLVVSTLDEVSRDALGNGRLQHCGCCSDDPASSVPGRAVVPSGNHPGSGFHRPERVGVRAVERPHRVARESGRGRTAWPAGLLPERGIRGAAAPYAEAAYGQPESGQAMINVTNGKLIRLLVDDEPFDVRYGELRSHQRLLDFRSGTLHRSAVWTSPSGRTVRLQVPRLVSFTQRAVAAISYQVEPLDDAVHIVLQSELVANEQLPPARWDPRAAAVLEAPLRSEDTQARAGGPSSSTRPGAAGCGWRWRCGNQVACPADTPPGDRVRSDVASTRSAHSSVRVSACTS